MFPLLNRFHALQTAETPTRHLFARLSEQRLDVLLADKAYVAAVVKHELPTARIRGSSHTLSTKLLSIVLSTPATSAVVAQNCNELVLTCVDNSSLPLVITIPVLPTPSEALLAELHQSLITAVSSLEACLLATFGEPEYTDPSYDIHGLEAIHATPKHGNDPISDFSPFRRMSSVSMGLLAARAFAVAQLASRCRTEKLQQKQARIEHMKRMKKRQRELVEQAKLRRAQRKRERSVFVEYKPEQRVEKQQPLEKLGSELGENNKLVEQTNSTGMLQTKADNNPSPEATQQPTREQNQVPENAAENKPPEPSSSAPKRKKRKKAQRLV